MKLVVRGVDGVPARSALARDRVGSREQAELLWVQPRARVPEANRLRHAPYDRKPAVAGLFPDGGG